jgi:regulator of extracellular matrix RemA (YlzA/DUF370 family)
MDRLIATEEEITEARRTQSARPAFTTAEEAAMTPEQFAQYEKLVTEARDEAFDALLFKVMTQIRRERTATWQNEYDEVRQQVREEVQQRPAFRAMAMFGSKENRVQLDKEWLINTYGEEIINQLPGAVPPIFTDKAPTAAQTIAELAGLKSADELITVLVEHAEKKRRLKEAKDNRSVLNATVNEEARAILIDRHGDILEDGSIEDEALSIIHNDKQGEALAMELRELGRRSQRKPTAYRVAKQWAEQKIRTSRVADALSGQAMQRYRRSAKVASERAEAAILAGDMEEAFRQKQYQLLNNALVSEAHKRKGELDSAISRLRNVARMRTSKSVDQDYLERAHELLENVDLRQRPETFLAAKESFEKWAAARRAEGDEVFIPEQFDFTADNWTRLTVEDLLSLRDMVDSLMALGRHKKTMLDNKARRDYEEWRDEAVEHIDATPGRKVTLDRNEEESMRRGLLAAGLKVEVLAQELDNDRRNGPWTRLLATRATEVANHRDEMRDRVMRPIVDAYNAMSAKQKARLSERVTVPEWPYRSPDDLDPRNGEPTTFTRWQILGMALNMGNASNLDKLVRGERVPLPVIQALVNRELTKEDLDFAQTVWDGLETLRPDIAATEKEMTGLEPEWIEAVPLVTPHGVYRGGYFPVVYDPAYSERAEQNETNAANDLFGNRSGITTSKGHTKTRTDYAAKLLLMPENVLFNHVEKVITRAAYAPWVRDVVKAISDPKVRAAIDRKFGPELRKMIRPWLQRQVATNLSDPRADKWVEKFLRTARINMSIVAMGIRFSTGVAQLVGLGNSIGRVGVKHMISGMRRMLTERGDAVQFIFDRSPEMQRRNESMNREMVEVFREMGRPKPRSGVTAAIAKKHAQIQAMAFWHIGMIDRYMVSAPTWLAAHEKGMEEGMTDADASAYADKIVRTTQGSGREKDLAKLASPNSEALRFFTMFYTPFSVLANAQWETVRAGRRGDWRKMAMMTFWFMIATPLVDAFVTADWPDEDSEEGWTSWLARNIGFYLFAGVPLLRDAGNYAERKIAGKYATFSPGPIGRIWDASTALTNDAWDVTFGDGEASDRWLRNAIETPGYFLGLPTGQPGATAQFLWDVNNGDQDPEGIGEWYRGFTKGKAKEEQ